MDSITQIALGAAVGEAVAGKKAGNKAMAWGAVAGTIPDLDIVLNPLLDSVQQLAMHRGLSHSFCFAICAAPLMGWLLAKLHPKSAAGFRDWTLLAGLCFVTHILLDFFTIYGTQLFRPFSEYPAAYGAVFIIDPLYTLPLIFGLIATLIARRKTAGATGGLRWNTIGLTVSSLYLLYAIGARAYAESVFRGQLDEQGISYERVFVGPLPLNTLSWNMLADDPAGDRVHFAVYSLFDDLDDQPMLFRSVAKHSERIAGAEDSRAIARLLWFSRGYYTIREDPQSGALSFNDMRFGRTDGWLEADGDYIFIFDLEEADDAAGPPGSRSFVNFTRRRPSFDRSGERLAMLWRRVSGERLELQHGSE